MRARLATALALALAVPGALAAPAAAESTLVSMGFSSFLPAQVEVLEGDSVAWRNASSRTHDIKSDSAGFDSGRVAGGDGFAHTFPVPGSFTYECTIHDTMKGEVAVYGLLLGGSRHKVPRGGSVVLRVRAPAGVAEVTIEEDSGSGFHPVATATAGDPEGAHGGLGAAAEGELRATVTPPAGSTYRAVAGERTSQPFRVEVSDAPGVALSSRARRGGALLTVHAASAPPGSRAVLQLRLRERFGWWTVGRARLDSRSRARFTLKRGGPVRARVALVAADWATLLTTSRPLTVRRSRR